MAKVPIMQIWDDTTQQYVAIPSIQGPKGDTGAAGTGVPDGGTAGQLLSRTESGTEWIDPPQSGA